MAECETSHEKLNGLLPLDFQIFTRDAKWCKIGASYCFVG